MTTLQHLDLAANASMPHQKLTRLNELSIGNPKLRELYECVAEIFELYRSAYSHEAAHALFSFVNPKSIYLKNKEGIPVQLTKIWEKAHGDRNKRWTGEIISGIQEAGNRGKLNVVVGPMFSAKSELIIRLAQTISSMMPGMDIGYAIAEILRETEVKTRIEGRSIRAGSYNALSLARMLDTSKSGSLRIIDEASFVPIPTQSGQDYNHNIHILNSALLEAVDRGVHLLICSLDTDVRHQEFPWWTSLKGQLPAHAILRHSTSYFIDDLVTMQQQFLDGKVPGLEATLTSRYNLTAGGIQDTVNEIVVPKDEAELEGRTIYTPITAQLSAWHFAKTHHPDKYLQACRLTEEVGFYRNKIGLTQ